MAENAEAVARAYFRWWKQRDFARLAQVLADDVTYDGPLAGTTGAAACRQALEATADLMTDLVVDRVFADGPEVTTWFELHTTAAPPVLVANRMHVRDGLITGIRAVYDPRALIENGGQMTSRPIRATEPEDLARLWVELANAGDADGLAELYEPEAVLDFPLGTRHEGRPAIREAFAQMLKHYTSFPPEVALPTLRLGDIALTATRPADDSHGRYQVARRQSDGSWLRILHSSGYQGRPATEGRPA